MVTGSSFDGEEGNGRWKCDGENWWYKVEYQGVVSSRLRRRISRSVKATLEQDTKRQRDGWYQLRSRIGWRRRSNRGPVKVSCGPVVSWWISRKGGQGFLGRASSCDARSWFASVVLRSVKEWYAVLVKLRKRSVRTAVFDRCIFPPLRWCRRMP